MVGLVVVSAPKPPCFCKQKHFVTESILFWGISWPFPWPEVFMDGLGREKEGECLVERVWGCLTSVCRLLSHLLTDVPGGAGGGWERLSFSSAGTLTLCLLDDNHYFQQR